MMEKLVGIAVIMLTSLICAGAYAQSSSGYTTVVVEYVGKSDRPIFPIIISSSRKEAEWYRDKLFADPVSSFTHIYIVPKAALKKISDIPLPKGDLSRSRFDAPTTAPILRLVMGMGHDSKEVTIGAQDSVALLGKIKEFVSEYRLLIAQLSEVEGRMTQYLRNPPQ